MTQTHQHLWCAKYVNRQWLRGVAQCATCRQEKPSRPATDFRAPTMNRQLEFERMFRRNDALVVTDLAGICPNCGETAYYNTSKKRAGAECVIYNFRCMACGHKDAEPLD